VRLLIDNNLPPRLAHSLAPTVQAEGHLVQHLRDKFGTGRIDDVDWIGALATEGGWCILSEDHHISRRPDELQALLTAKLICFFLQPAWSRGMDEITRLGRLILRFPDLAATATRSQRPAAYSVPIRGKIDRIRLSKITR
jgi:hypothetical protein